ncbi:MAG: SGNH/GDSL hydrolase family protein [Legionellaceae bacterium]|nr:SGNH/GDSL hydrolase family protein [Legionellaceae bacterium]
MNIFFIIFALLFSTLSFAEPLHKIVVFGDSLSDNGNLYEYMKHQLPLSPPYYEGRFTNGPVWVERLANTLYPSDWKAHLLDYAFGGAGVLVENGDFDDDVLFTLGREIDSYLLAHQNQADEHSLFVVWMGANNYLAVPDDVDETINAVNRNIKLSLQRLVDRGAKHILVINLPDLGNTPAAHDFEATDGLTYCSKTHNATLAKKVAQLQVENPSVQWLQFDVDQLFGHVMDDPSRFGFSNTTETCYEALLDFPSSKSVLNMVATVHPKTLKGSHACDGYFFFDPVHPTALAHQLMAERIHELLTNSGITFG